MANGLLDGSSKPSQTTFSTTLHYKSFLRRRTWVLAVGQKARPLVGAYIRARGRWEEFLNRSFDGKWILGSSSRLDLARLFSYIYHELPWRPLLGQSICSF